MDQPTVKEPTVNNEGGSVAEAVGISDRLQVTRYT